MANIRKQFNFRNGVQVDNDHLLVDSLGKVGIGTSVPSELLDVRGNVKVVGLVTSSEIFTTSLRVGFATDGTLGVSTFAGGIRVGVVSISQSGIVTATSGIVTYYGDGSKLSNLPTSQWLDVDIGLGFTSIYSQGYVGVGTISPLYPFQVGGTDSTRTFNSIGAKGVGIDTVGNIYATGIVTSSTFIGNLVGNITSSGIGTFNELKVGTVNISSGIITSTTFIGSLIGSVTGTASTAQGLSGTPNIIVDRITANSYNSSGILTTSTINSGFSTVGISTIHTLLNISPLAKIGVGTNTPNADVHIFDMNDGASLQLTSSVGNDSYISIGNSISRTQNNGELRFGNSNVGQYYSTPLSLDVINYGLGNLNYYLNLGSSGIGTGNFNWIYGNVPNSPIMTLTYGGNLGLGITNPNRTLHVVGTSTVTSNSYIGGNSYVSGSLFVGNITIDAGGITLPNIATLSGNVTGNLTGNVYSSGISTFNNLNIIGIVSTTSFSANNVGINTSASLTNVLTINPNTNNFYTSNQIIFDQFGSIGVGTTSINYPSGSNYKVSLDAARGIGYFQGVGVGTTTPSCFADFSAAGFNHPTLGNTYQFMLPPKVTTSVRNTLSVVEGGLIYNITNKRLELYNGTGWCGIATIP